MLRPRYGRDGDERGKWDKKGPGTFHGEMGEMAENGTSDDCDEERHQMDRPTQCISESSTLPDECSAGRSFSCTIAH